MRSENSEYQTISKYYDTSLRIQARQAALKRKRGLLPDPVKTDWEKVKRDIRVASNPSFKEVEGKLARDVATATVTAGISFITSNAEEGAALLVGNGLAFGLAEVAPQLLTENTFYPAVGLWGYLQYRWIKASLPQMYLSWDALEKYGISNSGGAKIAYEASKSLTDNIKVRKGFTYTGYWFNNAIKEALWIGYGTYAIPEWGGSTISNPDVYLPTLGMTLLAGANMGAEGAVKVQYKISENLMKIADKATKKGKA